MRIAFFTTRMMLGYGVDLTVHEIARRLVARGHSVDVWTPTSDGTYANEAYALREIIVYGEKQNRVLALLERNARTALRALRERLAEEDTVYDVVVPCTHPYYAAGEILGVPQVFFNFGNVPTTGFSWRGRLNWLWLDLAEQLLHKPASARVVSISQFLHNQQPLDVRRKGRVVHLGGDHYYPWSDESVKPASSMSAKTGEVRVYSLNEIRARMDDFDHTQHERIVVDLGDTSLFDGSGLGYLVVLVKQVKMNNGHIAFCSPNHIVKRLLSTIRIEKYVQLFDNCNQAVEYIQSLPAGGHAGHVLPVGDKSRPSPSSPKELRAALRRSFREAHGIPQEAVVIGYCGRLHRKHPAYKGVREVLAIGRRIRGLHPYVHTLLAGIGSADDGDWVREEGGIPLLNLPPADMPGFYAALDIYLTASRWEGFDLPIVEAAWHGVPAVAYNAGAHGEHVTAVLVHELTMGELGRATLTLVRDAKLRRQLGAQAFRLARNFSWERAAGEFETVLAEVVP